MSHYSSGWLDSSGCLNYPMSEEQETIFCNNNKIITSSKKFSSEFPELFEYKLGAWCCPEENIERTSISDTFLLRNKYNFVSFHSTKKESILRVIKKYRIKNL